LYKTEVEGNNYAKLGKYSEAISCYKRLLKIISNTEYKGAIYSETIPLFLFYVGLMYYNLEKYILAVIYFDKAKISFDKILKIDKESNKENKDSFNLTIKRYSDKSLEKTPKWFRFGHKYLFWIELFLMIFGSALLLYLLYQWLS